MKLGLGEIFNLALAGVITAIELVVWYNCHLETEASLHKDRQIAISASCNEQAELYSDRLDCADIKRSRQPGVAWVKSAQCLVSQHNIFSALGWMEIGAVVALGVLLLLVLLRHRLQVNKARNKQRRQKMLMQQYDTWPPPQHQQPRLLSSSN